MSRSQRHLRFFYGVDSQLRTAFELGEPSRIAPIDQYNLAIAKGRNPTTLTAPEPVPPTFITIPVVTSAVVGQPLVAFLGTVTGNPTPTITARVLRDGVDVGAYPGYVIPAEDTEIGVPYSVHVTASNGIGEDAVAESAEVEASGSVPSVMTRVTRMGDRRVTRLDDVRIAR